ncbi:tRNA (cytidine(34)-2'-O)-methyltransferase, partial [Paenibacillus sp. MCAF20]
MPFHIVLVEPEIPANTGNISRTCAATGTHLHLVRPLGFDTDDRTLKRAGLDYWHSVHIEYHDSFDEVLALYPEGRFFYASTRASKPYSDFEYRDG